MTQPAGAVLSISSKQGTQREYETTIVLRPDVNKSGIADLVGKLQAIFEREGSRLQKIDNWGVRTLAYPIGRAKKGIYVYARYLGGSTVVTELERNLRIDEAVIRYLTVLVDEDVDPSARPSDVTKEQLDAASESARDPLEILAEQQAKAREEAAAAAERGDPAPGARGGRGDFDDDFDDEDDDFDDDEDEENER